MKSIGEALAAMMPSFSPLATERVGLDEADGRFLAEDVMATADAPPFDNSAMDGWAVRASDVASATPKTPVRLPRGGESRAGSAPGPLADGTAMRIFTGAPMPAGSDAVVIQENTSWTDDEVTVTSASSKGHHVRRRGEDLEAGTVALARGCAIGPGEIALLASQRITEALVHRRPVVSVLSSGDELREPTDPPEPGTIVTSNAYALASQIRRAGGIPRVLPIARDEISDLVTRLTEALEADVVVSTGGVSVGDYDLMGEAFERVGVEVSFTKVRIKPGKPVTFGTLKKRRTVPVVGLPGNPASAMVTFELFVRPGLRRMLGDPRPHRAVHRVRLGADHAHRSGRPELARARLERRDGSWIALPHTHQGSGSMTSGVGTDCLVLLDADRERWAAGDELLAFPFPAWPGSADPVFD